MNEVMSFGERRVVKIRYTRYIALPPDWVRDNVGEKETIRLTLQADRSLRIDPTREEPRHGGSEKGEEAHA